MAKKTPRADLPMHNFELESLEERIMARVNSLLNRRMPPDIDIDRKIATVQV